jgi:hypothetical protein
LNLYENPEFIKAVELLPDVTYMVSISQDTLCWPKRPMTTLKEYQWGGEMKTRTALSDIQQKPITVETLAKSTNKFFWYRREVSEGTKGPIVYEFSKRRITLSKSGLPQREVTLLIRRTISDGKGSYSHFISNASPSTKLKDLVWLSGMRWAIEQCFEETKTELGMDHYEVRKFMGWHHHILTCMMAHFFLWHLKIRLGKKTPSITVSQLRVLIRLILPMKKETLNTLLDQITWVQNRNHQAYLSHRRKRIYLLAMEFK